MVCTRMYVDDDVINEDGLSVFEDYSRHTHTHTHVKVHVISNQEITCTVAIIYYYYFALGTMLMLLKYVHSVHTLEPVIICSTFFFNGS